MAFQYFVRYWQPWLCAHQPELLAATSRNEKLYSSGTLLYLLFAFPSTAGSCCALSWNCQLKQIEQNMTKTCVDQASKKSEAPQEYVQLMKTTLKISPGTCRHLYAMGFQSLADLSNSDIDADKLNTMFREYLLKKWPGKKPFNYTVACRRMLWAARATPAERAAHPEKFLCKSWSNKALTTKE